MGFRFRKSIKLAPGVKLNLGKKSAGISVGGKLAGVSLNSRTGGRARVSLPGTGLSYSTKIGDHTGGRSRKRASTQMDSPAGSPAVCTDSAAPCSGRRPPNWGKIIRWVLAAIVCVWAIVNIPSATSVLLTVLAVLIAPIGAIDRLLAERLHIKKWIKVTGLTALFILALCLSPTSPDTSTAEQAADSLVQQTQTDTAASSGITASQFAEEFHAAIQNAGLTAADEGTAADGSHDWLAKTSGGEFSAAIRISTDDTGHVNLVTAACSGVSTNPSGVSAVCGAILQGIGLQVDLRKTLEEHDGSFVSCGGWDINSITDGSDSQSVHFVYGGDAASRVPTVSAASVPEEQPAPSEPADGAAPAAEPSSTPTSAPDPNPTPTPTPEPEPSPAPDPEPTPAPTPTLEPTPAPDPEPTPDRTIPYKENYHGHIYATPKGKRYHYEANCGGKNSEEITWDIADRRHLTPCGTCVAH